MDELMEANEGDTQENKGEMQSENMTENLKLKKILELQKTVLNKIINASNQIEVETPNLEEKKLQPNINLKRVR